MIRDDCGGGHPFSLRSNDHERGTEQTANGFDVGGDNRNWNIIEETSKWCNDYQVWFDVHNRYRSIEEGEAIAEDMFTFGTNQEPWTYPMHVVCLEMAPKVDQRANTWWTSNSNASKLRFDKFLNMPNCNQNPGEDWEDYISDPINGDGWKEVQFSGADYFGLDDVIYAMYYPHAFTVICYGSALQGPEPEPIHDLPAIRAQNVCDLYIQTQYKFTEFRNHYQTIADPYQIVDFDPHDTCDVCGN